MPANSILPAVLVILLMIPAPSLAADDWYQIDVIVFKPRTVNLDEEAWPEFEPSYPADVKSVDEPRVFRLSQLEQIELDNIEMVDVPETQALSSNEFVFRSASRSNRNRRVIEAVTGAGDVEPGTEAPIEDEPAAAPVDLETVIREAIESSHPDSPGALAFRKTEDNSSLQRVLGSLRRSSRFDVLTHLSWIQPLNDDPSPMLVQAGERFDDRFEVEGTLSFTRTRFLHVATDLWYTAFEPREASVNPFLQGFSSSLPDEVLREYPDLVEVEQTRGQYVPARMHLMNQSRRMRSSETHYIDHPLFGVVVQINEVDKPTQNLRF